MLASHWPYRRVECLRATTSTMKLQSVVFILTLMVAIVLTACNKGGEAPDDQGVITRVSLDIPSLTPTDTANLEVSPDRSRELGISRILIKVVRETPESSIKIEKLSQPPTAVPPLEAVYSYFRIEAESIPDHYLEEVIIEFALATSWLEEMEADAGDVTLFRLVEREWTPLQTQAVEFSDVWIAFEASSPGLSLFAAGLGPSCQPTGPFQSGSDRAFRIIGCAMQRAMAEDADLPTPYLAEIADAMKEWFEIDVRPSLIEARECWLTEGCGTELILESAVQLLVEWRVGLMSLDSFGTRQVLQDLEEVGRVLALALFDAAFTKTCRETAARTTFTFDSPYDTTLNVTETGLVTALGGPTGQVSVLADEERVKSIELVQRLVKLMPGFVTQDVPREERGPDGLRDAIYICGAVSVRPAKGELQVGESVQLTASITDPYSAESGYDAVSGQANFIIFGPDRTPPDLDFHTTPPPPRHLLRGGRGPLSGHRPRRRDRQG